MVRYDRRNLCKILIRKLEGKIILGRSEWIDNNIRLDLKGLG
jgi:hypothetical protein